MSDEPECPSCHMPLDYVVYGETSGDTDEPDMLTGVPVCINPECDTNKES